MNQPHRMTLRPPWEQEHLPDGRTRFCRRFGCPRTLADGETVWLVGEVPGGGVVWLNDEPLGESAERFAFEVTTRLRQRNELRIDSPVPIGTVVVEVRAS